MKRSKRIAVGAVVIGMVFSLAGCGQIHTLWEQQNFDYFMDNQFDQAVRGSYLTAHTYLGNSSDYEATASLGSRFGIVSMVERRSDLARVQEEFQEFDRSLLTAGQQDLYDLFEYELNLQIEQSDFRFNYYEQLFQSMTGLHYQLPSLFADWKVRGGNEAEQLIALVLDVKPYVDSALEYTRQQAELGLLMADLDSVMAYCSGILEKGENSTILSSMIGGIEALNLDAQVTEDYRTRLAEAFRTSFLPAFQAIYDTMKELKESGKNNEQGLAYFEHGREYFELLMRMNTGTQRSVEEIRQMIRERLDTYGPRIQQLVLQNSSVRQVIRSGVFPETGYTDYNAILSAIQGRMVEDFPEVEAIRYEIRDIDPEIASSSGIAAYFNIPALDGSEVNQLRINPNLDGVASLPVYCTVAHEGLPGHMYQYAYMYEKIDSDYVKALAYVPAYTEGYAVYAEYEAMRYLDEIDPAVREFYQVNELISYCLSLLADIGIHYDGWQLEDFSRFLDEKGFAVSAEAAEAQYRQLQANPCAFEPYYVGYFEILALREHAQQELGDRFEAKAFHEALLSSGTAPFSVVERNVQAYVDSVLMPAA